MTERVRSKDGSRETDDYIEDMPKTPDHQGRQGGDIAREVGTRDALLRANTQGARGVTRIGKTNEVQGGNRNGEGPAEMNHPEDRE
ncbi:hypothetical protein [Jannaschia aquimarina]|uniref:Uncharacterized protein n=1 Tax=Jannaschia aquimarina TaxID=935700 RepID=A0A0D1CMG8_9RHOB|nr:hypothetical protein [Jannaschia aquimarina]KIT15982.1 hypothetical protein jaqu_22520 [Jannaschia aquimarina]SNS99280.1 hypothetical protein SAMN05421775_104163 [Jannaschia aquimarina]